MSKLVKAAAGLVSLVILGTGGLLIYAKSRLDSALIPPTSKSALVVDLAMLDQAEPHGKSLPPVTYPAELDWTQIFTPTPDTMPWARWWWPGADIDSQSISTQIQQLSDASFGGVEIQAFKVGMALIEDEERMERVNAIGSPRFYEEIAHSIEEARKRGMQVDLTHGSGWPPGGQHISIENSLQMLQFTELRISGSKELSLELPRPTPNFDDYIFAYMENERFSKEDFVNFAADYAKLKSVVAYQIVGGERASNPLVFNDQLKIDPLSEIVLDEHISNNQLTWKSPPGEWVIVSAWQMPVASAPVLAAGESSGYVIDHLRSELIRGNYAFSFGSSTGLDRYYGNGLRGIFNDSLEFKANRLTRADIFEQFKKRKGYDLQPYIGALSQMGADNFYFLEVAGVRPAPEYNMGSIGERIRYDYTSVVSDLVIEEFIETSKSWAESRGMTSRGQSYGMNLDVLRGLGNNSIPETEQLYSGGGDAGLKLPASAAMHYGKPLVSAESFVWSGRSHGTTPLKAKAATDKLFIAGVNHIFYHGVPYIWHGGEPGSVYGPEGWHPFSNPDTDGMTFSSFISPSNPLWDGFAQLNSYIGRAQYLLRAGKPDVDVLIYYPFIGFPSSYGESEKLSTEPLVQGKFPVAEPSSPDIHALLSGKFADGGPDQRVAWLESLLPLTRALDKHGLTWAWTGAHPLSHGVTSPGHLKSGGKFGAILIPGIERIELEAAERLLALSSEGQKIIIFGKTPNDVPGYKDAESKSESVRKAFSEIYQNNTIQVSSIPEWVQALKSLGSENFSVNEETNLKTFRRTTKNGEIVFISNPEASANRISITVKEGQDIRLFDAERSELWSPRIEGGQLMIDLQAYESLFLIANKNISAEDNAATCRPENSEATLLENWLVAPLGNKLIDWRLIDGMPERDTPLTYIAKFNLDEIKARHSIDFEMIHGQAEIRVNGKLVNLIAAPPFRLDITDALLAGENHLEVSLTPAMRNALIKKAELGDTRYQQLLEFTGQYQASGIVGDVTLLNCKYELK